MNVAREQTIAFESLDGVRLEGTLVRASRKSSGAVLLVHGLGESRDEVGGFHRRLSERLVQSGCDVLRIDLRGHGRSEGTLEELSLCGAMSDVCAALHELAVNTGSTGPAHLVGTSFGGGVAALVASRYPETVKTLVLLNPNLDYRANWLERKPYWQDGHLAAEGRASLREKGWLPHGDFRIGRPMLNEILHLRPSDGMDRITCPTLVVHGTADSVVPFATTEANYRTSGECELLRMAGLDHGFGIPGDDDLTDPRTLEAQTLVIEKATAWILGHTEEVR